jgi:hypothetical protein
MAFKSASDQVGRDDFEKVIEVLVGPSRWQDPIVANLPKARANSGKPLFQIKNSKDYQKELSEEDKKDASHLAGITKKKEGRIVMQDFFGQNKGAASLGHVLHEAVHWVSDPAGKSGTGHSTARVMLGTGLFEGLVEAVTEDILQTQGIALASPDKRGHRERVAMFRYLCRIMENRNQPRDPVAFFGSILFHGDLTHANVLQEMIWTFSDLEWLRIRQLAGDNKQDAAISTMKQAAAKQEAIHDKEDEAISAHFARLRRVETNYMPGVTK